MDFASESDLYISFLIIILASVVEQIIIKKNRDSILFDVTVDGTRLLRSNLLENTD